MLQEPARLENFQPHMHLRGKAMSMEAILPGRHASEMLSYVDRLQLQLDDQLHLRGRCRAGAAQGHDHPRHVAWHDNTTANKNNPIPNQWVGWGDRTVDEMAHAWVNVTYISDEDYQAYLAKK